MSAVRWKGRVTLGVVVLAREPSVLAGLREHSIGFERLWPAGSLQLNLGRFWGALGSVITRHVMEKVRLNSQLDKPCRTITRSKEVQ